MKICIVGNVMKDVYLNLDSRTEPLETDQNGSKWLDVAFNTSEHHFYSRTSTYAGAAISLEVLEKMGVKSFINSAKIRLETDGLVSDTVPDTYRYILIADDEAETGENHTRDRSVSYFVPSHPAYTSFTAPSDPIDYLYIDRSAFLSRETAAEIIAYLDISSETKLALYVQDPNDPNYRGLIERADLIFLEETPQNRHHQTAQSTPVSLGSTSSGPHTPSLNGASPSDLDTAISATSVPLSNGSFTPNPDAVIVRLSDSQLRVGPLVRSFSLDRVNLQTHLSSFSILAGTILGALYQGRSLEDSLSLAIANAENSRLNATLPLSKLDDLVKNAANTPSKSQEIELIAANLMLSGKGILAADESGGSINRKFAQLNIPDTYQNRRDYRNLLFTTPQLSKFVNGVILFDETSKQFADDGQNFVDFLTSRQIIPGIKVDQGLEKLGATEEMYTKGLDGLAQRLEEYYNNGLRFAKWRAAFSVTLSPSGQILTPSEPAIDENCRIMAEYALECQKAGLVPIVEPELVYDGYYSIDQSASLTSHILDVLFAKLKDAGVNLKACILKVNMVLAGQQFGVASTPVEVGTATAKVLKEHVPEELAGIVFLSGGQTPEQATSNLAEVMKNGPFPWPVSFSFARALQDPALAAWAGNNDNTVSAQKAFLDRLKANTEALLAVDF